MSTKEREEFDRWLYSQKPAPWRRFTTADEIGFFVWQHQQSSISDLERQLSNTQYERNQFASELMRVEQQNKELREALTRLRDCDWRISLPDRMDAVRDIARKALAGQESK